jgi:hypothetical protein
VRCLSEAGTSLLLDSALNTPPKPMKMLLGLSEALSSLAEARFISAKATSSLLFSPTEVAVIRTSSGIPVAFRPRVPAPDHHHCTNNKDRYNCASAHRLPRSPHQSMPTPNQRIRSIPSRIPHLHST